jgi:hypothetical protein
VGVHDVAAVPRVCHPPVVPAVQGKQQVVAPPAEVTHNCQNLPCKDATLLVPADDVMNLNTCSCHCLWNSCSQVIGREKGDLVTTTTFSTGALTRFWQQHASLLQPTRLLQGSRNVC